MTMMRFRRALLSTAALTAAFLSSSGWAAPWDDAQAYSTWSEGVWKTALRGDSDALRQSLANLPGEPEDTGLNQRRAAFAKLLERSVENREKAYTDQETSRNDALVEMRTHLQDADLSQALTSAVKAQDYSADFDRIFDEPEIPDLIARAEAELAEAEAAHDWLHARDLLFLLRTLHEDTSRLTEYEAYDDRLEQVNRRVLLVARYAPRTLHELRKEQAERLGEDPIEEEFNPNLIQDWQERVGGVTASMVKSSLRTAAREHIEATGYAKMLQGGLEALNVFATTEALTETFDRLGDERAVADWTDAVEKAMAALKQHQPHEVNSVYCQRLLDTLLTENERTIQLPRGVLYREFGDGAMEALDPFTEIIWPDKLRRFQQAVEGSFVGVGILIRHNEKREILVVNPLEGTPAYFAGIKPEDLIVQVDGESTVGWTLNDAVDRITGKESSVVNLGIKREGEEELLQFPITRERIKLQSVYGWWKTGLDENGDPQWDWYVDPVSEIAYIRLTQFTEDSYADLLRAWDQINDQKAPRGLILDLRYNPGGLLDAAVRVSNLFVTGGEVVSGENKDGQTVWRLDAEPHRAALQDVPVVVLINKGSASASEIVSGALQAYGAAIIVGERSYGKGSVQTVHHVTKDSRLKLTTQYYRLPAVNDEKGRLVHRRPGATVWGVDPDVPVKMTAMQVRDALTLRQEADVLPLDAHGDALPESKDRPDLSRVLTEGMDPQLEMALLILQARAMDPNLGTEQLHAAQ